MTDREKQRDEIILAVKEIMFRNSYPIETNGDINLIFDDNGIDHVGEEVAKKLYGIGYRKTFTSELASDIQRAFKEEYSRGYDEGFDDGKEQAYKDCYEKTREETAKEIFQKWYDDVVHGMGMDGYYIKEYAEQYGVEIKI